VTETCNESGSKSLVKNILHSEPKVEEKWEGTDGEGWEL
jgi:hypothetical protein